MAIRMMDRFPGANVRVLELTQAPRPEVVFAADPHGGPESLWFYFKLEDREPPDNPPESLTLTLRFFENMLGGSDPAACRPVTRVAGKNWNRLRAPVVTTLADGQPLLHWTVPYPLERTELALCYPYGRDELDVLLRRSKGYWRETAIGLTQGGHVLTRLDNGSAVKTGKAASRGLYLLARQHAGETPGSWVLDGLLEGISRSKAANWCVWAIPFAHLDGVLDGDYGKDPFPYDLNRAWGTPPMRHETLVLQRDMQRWAARCRPELLLDLHAPGACQTAGIYTYTTPGESDDARDNQAWVNVLQQALGAEFAAESFARTATYPSRWTTPTAKDYAQQAFGCAAITIETPYALCGDTVMAPKQYREAGRRLAHGILTRWS